MVLASFMIWNEILKILETYFRHSISGRFVHLDVNEKIATSKLVTEFEPEAIVHPANYSSSHNIARDEDKYQQLSI